MQEHFKATASNGANTEKLGHANATAEACKGFHHVTTWKPARIVTTHEQHTTNASTARAFRHHLWALERLLVCVQALVHTEVGAVPRAVLTEFTRKWPVSRVPHFVRLQAGAVFCRVIARRAVVHDVRASFHGQLVLLVPIAGHFSVLGHHTTCSTQRTVRKSSICGENTGESSHQQKWSCCETRVASGLRRAC